jgi:MinD-like ATPase involved in chromosome partitioning or flagellar assembly
VLIDANDVTPSIAQRLALPLHPNIRTAIDAVDHNIGRLTDAVMNASENEVTVICGLPHAKDWMSLRPEEVSGVVREVLRVVHHVVVDVAAELDDLAGVGGIDRFGTARLLLEEADSIILVGVATPVGIARLLDQIAELNTLAGTTPIHLVINRAPAHGAIRSEIAEELARTFRPKSLHFVAYDKKVDEAAWEGKVSAQGAFSTAVTGLLSAALGAAGEGQHSAKSARRLRRAS